MRYSQAKPSKEGFYFMVATEPRVIVYIDGYNFYYGMRENNWKRYYWLDIVKFCESFLKNGEKLIKVKYFSAPTKSDYKKSRQQKFFDANNFNDRFELILGSYLEKEVECQSCYETNLVPEEKKTDVNIATHMIADCVYNECDVSILISADSDLTPPIEFIKNHSADHRIYVHFPPKRHSAHLKLIAHGIFYLDRFKQRFVSNQFPEMVEVKNGFEIHQPDKWKKDWGKKPK